MDSIKNLETMEFMIWVIEITARHYFNGSKGAAYDALNENGIWAFYVSNYDTTHSLSAEVIIDEIGERLSGKEMIIT